jgi:uncharacterized phage protein (TIGR01671 family)
MREIKFRAWDKERKEMFIPRDLEEVPKVAYFLPSKSMKIKGRNLELMQFTGLKDKNGKEIYEGDIVLEKEYLYDVSFGKIFDPDRDEYTYGYFDYTDGEVIGNIHENPELLKENKK